MHVRFDALCGLISGLTLLISFIILSNVDSALLIALLGAYCLVVALETLAFRRVKIHVDVGTRHSACGVDSIRAP